MSLDWPIEVVEDRSPVMSSPLAFLAKYEQKARRIVINGAALDALRERGEDPIQARELWVAHEIFHALVHEEIGKPIPDEEKLADRFAQEWVGLRENGSCTT